MRALSVVEGLGQRRRGRGPPATDTAHARPTNRRRSLPALTAHARPTSQQRPLPEPTAHVPSASAAHFLCPFTRRSPVPPVPPTSGARHLSFALRSHFPPELPAPRLCLPLTPSPPDAAPPPPRPPSADVAVARQSPVLLARALQQRPAPGAHLARGPAPSSSHRPVLSGAAHRKQAPPGGRWRWLGEGSGREGVYCGELRLGRLGGGVCGRGRSPTHRLQVHRERRQRQWRAAGSGVCGERGLKWAAAWPGCAP